MGLFEGLTVPAKQVLARATEAAAAMGSHEVEGAHLLVGFLDPDTVARLAVKAHLPDRDVVVAAAQRATLASRDGAHPAFGDEVCLTLAAARGIAVGRGSDTVGTGALLLALLTLAPRSVEEVLAAVAADGGALKEAAGGWDDAAEPTGPPPGEAQPWTATVATGADGWDDHR
ncbi:MAG: Clp protease N-terminal domain-containing protein [Acidimicrobiia bacterium]